MYYHCIVFFDVQNLVLCLTRGLIQSMTLGFGTYKPFRPVLMRTLLARMHIHWPESKFTKSNINSKKVMKSITSITISRLFSWIKKYMSLCLEFLQFVLLIFITPLPSASCHILVHVKSLRSSLGRIWAKQVKMPPLFFRINFFFQNAPNIVCQNGMLNKKKSTQTTISCVVIYDLSSKLTCSNYLIATDTTFTFHDKWIMLLLYRHFSSFCK
jgi:hypothetical protein